MESRQVIRLEVRSRQRRVRRAAGADTPVRDVARDELDESDVLPVAALDHHEIDDLLLREARRASESLMKASAALHAASSVVLDAVAALREERDAR